MAVSFVIVVCTKCGKPHEREYDGYVSNFSCAGCGKLAWVGGKPKGLKSLPVKEFAVVLGVFFPLLAAFLVYRAVTVEIDPLDHHRAAIKSLALSLIRTNTSGQWENPRIVAQYMGFESDNKECWSLLEFEYDVSGNQVTSQLPIRFEYIKLPTEEAKWRIKAVGQRFEGEPMPLLNDSVNIDWNRYRWRGYTDRVQKKIVNEMVLGQTQ